MGIGDNVCMSGRTTLEAMYGERDWTRWPWGGDAKSSGEDAPHKGSSRYHTSES